MRSNRPLLALIASLSISLATLAARPKAACPAGETRHQGKCVKACAAEGDFGQPDGCDCPEGFGKLLLGDGNGRCARLRCPTGAAFAADKSCDCPMNYVRAPQGKGKARCEARKAGEAPAAR